MTAAMLIAVTGGSGFIGRRFVAQARSSGYRVRLLARRGAAPCEASDDVRTLDLGSGMVDADLLRGCAAVVHLAAYIPPDHDDPEAAAHCCAVNALGTLALARAAAEAGVRHFVQTTSANAYAPWEQAPDETAALFPRSRGYYLGSKVLQEIYAAEACRAAGLPLATLRLASVYGPGQGSGAIATLVARIAAGERVLLAGGGRFGADFVHVDDVVTALMLVLARRCAGAFNVGSGSRTTVGEAARLILALCGGEVALLETAPDTADPDEGFPALSVGKLRALGYAPRDLAAGLATMLPGR